MVTVRDYSAEAIAALAAVFRPHLGEPLVREGLGEIRRAFISVDHVGPTWLASFLGLDDPEERAVIQRRAYELVASWFERMNFVR